MRSLSTEASRNLVSFAKMKALYLCVKSTLMMTKSCKITGMRNGAGSDVVLLGGILLLDPPFDHELPSTFSSQSATSRSSASEEECAMP